MHKNVKTEANTSDIQIRKKAARIRLVLTDCDGVLTDAGVYYSGDGEALKRFSMRDGMGVERLRELAGVEVGIVTGENSPIVAARAAKLKITRLYAGVKDKARLLDIILAETGMQADEIAFIGDDLNDAEILKRVGLSACPSDAMPQIISIATYQCQKPGGHGAFREFAELIVAAKTESSPKNPTIPVVHLSTQ
ncbi:MAG: HAD-IIIA family hydrolase [Lewinellaceae bacterium]|nr:HAD-IIIA family hydrolase [Lewinellaceae bacterium]